MQVFELDIDEIKPYHNNPRHNDDAVPAVMASIREFGFKVPLVIDKNNEIITGHTRYMACEALGIKKIPCVRADDLTEQQVKAFRIADNKVSEIATWDDEKLKIELSEINIDMSDFNFEMPEIDIQEPEEDDGYYGDFRETTFNAYNMHAVDYCDLSNDFWQMPIIHKETFIPDELLRFNYAMTDTSRTNCGIHFYIDDYRFESIWTTPNKHLDKIKLYQCMLSPDFSLYMEMTEPQKIWNVYRSRLIGAYYQSQGVKVIPTLQWADENSFEYCFKGLEKGGVVSVSTVGTVKSDFSQEIWADGMKEAIRQLEPQAILLYGKENDFDFGDIEVVKFQTDKFWDQERTEET